MHSISENIIVLHSQSIEILFNAKEIPPTEAPTYGASYGEGKVQGVVKAAQTGILWSQVQVLVGPPFTKASTPDEISNQVNNDLEASL